MKDIDTKVVITGLICITGLEIVALCMGFNATLLKTVLVILAVGTGIVIPTPQLLKKK